MKIERKHEPYVVESDTLEEFISVSKKVAGWVDTEDMSIYFASDWELVPERVQVDVTGECEIQSTLGHQNDCLSMPCKRWQALLGEGYQYRKVEAYWLPHTMEKIKEKWLFTKDPRTFEEYLDQYKTRLLKIVRVEEG